MNETPALTEDEALKVAAFGMDRPAREVVAEGPRIEHVIRVHFGDEGPVVRDYADRKMQVRDVMIRYWWDGATWQHERQHFWGSRFKKDGTASAVVGEHYDSQDLLAELVREVAPTSIVTIAEVTS